MTSDELFRLASVNYDSNLGEDVHSVFIDNNYFENGESFVFEESLDVLENLQDLDADRKYKPVVVFEGGVDYSGNEADALLEQFSDNGYLEMDRNGLVKPGSFEDTRSNVVEDTLKGVR